MICVPLDLGMFLNDLFCDATKILVNSGRSIYAYIWRKCEGPSSIDIVLVNTQSL